MIGQFRTERERLVAELREVCLGGRFIRQEPKNRQLKQLADQQGDRIASGRAAWAKAELILKAFNTDAARILTTIAAERDRTREAWVGSRRDQTADSSAALEKPTLPLALPTAWSAAILKARFQHYQTAVLTPGFSAAQRRLLYRAALRDLAAAELFTVLAAKPTEGSR